MEAGRVDSHGRGDVCRGDLNAVSQSLLIFAVMMRRRFVLVWVAVCAATAGCGGGDARETPGPVNVNASGGVVAASVPLQSPPRVATSPDGTVWLTWTEVVADGEVAVAARVDSGGDVKRWTLSAAATQSAREPQVVVAGGTALMAWWESTASGTSRLRVSVWDGSRWRLEQLVESPGFVLDGTELLASPDGSAHLIWSEYLADNSARIASVSRSASGLWSVAQTIRVLDPSLSLVASPTAAVDSRGALALLWTESIAASTTASQPQTLWWSQREPAASVWNAPVSIESGGGYFGKVVSIDTRDWIACGFGDEAAGRRGLRCKRTFNGVWEAASTRVDAEADEDPRELSLSSEGPVVRLAFTADPAGFIGQRTVRVAQLGTATGQWNSPVLVDGPLPSQPAGLRLRQQSDGKAALTWGGVTGPGDPRVVLAESAGVWGAPLQLEPQGVSANSPDLAPMADGGWWVTWYRFVSGGRRQDVVLRRLP